MRTNGGTVLQTRMDPSLPPAPDVSGKSDAEIMEMIRQLQDEIKRLGEETDAYRERQKTMEQERSRMMSTITEVKRVADRRVEVMEKMARLQRKIVSIVQRYPTLLDASNQIISNNVSIMKRQLDLLNERCAKAEATITTEERRREDLEQKMAGVKGNTRREEEMIHRRDRDKANLVQTLMRELDGAKGLYQADSRAIDRELRLLNQTATELNGEFVKIRQAYDKLANDRPAMLSTASPVNADASQALARKRQELITTVTGFLEYWAQRRMRKYWNDREEILTKAVARTTDRRAESYKSINKLIETNQSTNAELARVRSIKNELQGRLDLLQKQIADRNAEIARLREKKANPKYTAQDGVRIAKMKQQVQELEREAKISEIEVRSYEGSGTGPTRGEMYYVSERRKYRKQLGILSTVIINGEKLKEKKGERHGTKELTFIHDPALVVSEDGDDILVQAATLEWVAKMVFHRGNTDPHYMQAVLVLVHSEPKNIDMGKFTSLVVEAYNQADIDVRNERLRELMDVWTNWFPDDFHLANMKPHLSQFYNLLGTSGVFDPISKSNDDVIWDSSVPFNDKEKDLLFCADPYILAEHFTYLELKTLRSMQPSEFLNCSWSALDKMEKSPHVCQMTEQFNTMSRWICLCIVKEKNIKDRCRIIERWVQVLEAALEILNYQLVFEIFGALCNPAITRLKKTMAAVDPETRKVMDQLRALTTPTARFEAYRNKLRETAKQITLPYIGPMLTALVYVADGNPSKKPLPDTGEFQWGISKFRTYSQTMAEICSAWGSELKFVLNPELFRRVASLSQVEQSDGELFQMSRDLEA